MSAHPNLEFEWKQLQPSTDTGGSDGVIPCPRCKHGLCLVNNRLVLIGGETSDGSVVGADQFCWALDLNAEGEGEAQEGSWRLIAQGGGGDTPSPRYGHAQARINIKDGQKSIYIFGGKTAAGGDKCTNDLWELDCSGEPGTEKWNKIESSEGTVAPEPRCDHRMVSIGKCLYVYGGCCRINEGDTIHRFIDMHKFDTTTRTWEVLESSPLLRGRYGTNLLKLASGIKLGVVGGYTSEYMGDGNVYNVEDNAWEKSLLKLSLSKYDVFKPRCGCVAACYPSMGLSFVFGGEVGGPGNKYANDVAVLDESKGILLKQVTALFGMPWPCERGWANCSASASLDSNGQGKLYVFGGVTCDGDGKKRYLNDLWKADITDDDLDSFLDLDDLRRAT